MYRRSARIIVSKIFIMIPLFLLFFLISSTITQDIIFPGQAPKIKNETITSRMDVKCPINMTTIEEDGETVCECVSGYLYHPPLDGCFKPYTRGPCTAGYYFILPSEETIARCVENPCNEGSVLYNNACHKLLKTGAPCKNGQTLVVNETTYALACEEVFPVLYQVIIAPMKRCARGSKMIARGSCRTPI